MELYIEFISKILAPQGNQKKYILGTEIYISLRQIYYYFYIDKFYIRINMVKCTKFYLISILKYCLETKNQLRSTILRFVIRDGQHVMHIEYKQNQTISVL